MFGKEGEIVGLVGTYPENFGAGFSDVFYGHVFFLEWTLIVVVCVRFMGNIEETIWVRILIVVMERGERGKTNDKLTMAWEWYGINHLNGALLRPRRDTLIQSSLNARCCCWYAHSPDARRHGGWLPTTPRHQHHAAVECSTSWPWVFPIP